jgi:Fe-S oxidoreductase
LGARKARLLAETGADLVVTANPGCLGQIADGLAVLPGNGPPVLPLGDLLWYAALRGRKP